MNQFFCRTSTTNPIMSPKNFAFVFLCSITKGGASIFLPNRAEAELEARAIETNKEQNSSVLKDFPPRGSETLIFNVGSTTTQIYKDGECVGILNGGTKEWDNETETTAAKIIEDNRPKQYEPLRVVVVGAPGYLVPDDPVKWVHVKNVDTPITNWLSRISSDSVNAWVLNRIKKYKHKQLNCDWGSSLSQIKWTELHDIWDNCIYFDDSDPNLFVLDIGGGYSRLYRNGKKISEWDDYRSSYKTNDLLFPDNKFNMLRMGILEQDMKRAFQALIDNHYQKDPKILYSVLPVLTGKVRDEFLQSPDTWFPNWLSSKIISFLMIMLIGFLAWVIP